MPVSAVMTVVFAITAAVASLVAAIMATAVVAAVVVAAAEGDKGRYRGAADQYSLDPASIRFDHENLRYRCFRDCCISGSG